MKAAVTEAPGAMRVMDVPDAGEVKLRLNHHFRVQPGAQLSAALQQIHASARYVF